MMSKLSLISLIGISWLSGGMRSVCIGLIGVALGYLFQTRMHRRPPWKF